MHGLSATQQVAAQRLSIRLFEEQDMPRNMAIVTAFKMEVEAAEQNNCAERREGNGHEHSGK